MTQSRWESWALWLAIASLVAFVVLNVTGVDIGGPLNTVMDLLLPVLVAFGIINDPTVKQKLFGDGDQVWYQSWTVWLALSALIVYCARLIFGIDMSASVNGLMDVLLPILMALGIVKNPTNSGHI